MDARARELETFNAQRRSSLQKNAVPLLYAPLLPLIRLSLRSRPVLRDRVFAAAILVALSHAGYIMSHDTSV